MKRITYLLIFIISLFLGGCTSLLETDSGLLRNTATKVDNLETMEITLEAAGTLAEKIGNKKDAISKLIVSGPFDADDVTTMRALPKLQAIDMKGVRLIESDKKYNGRDWSWSIKEKAITEEMFADLKLMEVVIPKDIEIIGGRAFMGTAIETIELPEGIKLIDYEAFAGCRNLLNIIIPKNVLKIGNGAFMSCSALNTITLPEGLTSIGGTVFSGCGSLTTIDIPETVTDIGNNAFNNSGLKSITIPESVTVIPSGCFVFCESLELVSISSHVTTIESEAFRSCTSLKSIIIPDNVIEIGMSAFWDCTALESVILSDNIKCISKLMFRNCYALKSIRLPSKLESIGEQSFICCTSLRYLEIPESVTSIEYMAFQEDYHLYAIVVKGHPVIQKIVDSDANTLIYLSDPDTDINASNKNVIINGMAPSITLNNRFDFYCPQTFKTQKITYTHTFNSTNSEYPIPGEAAGWVGLSLPFTVTNFAHKDGRVLAPFNADVPDAKPFWLRKLTANGFENATTMEAGVPYVIAMPHNERYNSAYNIEGEVTFMATDVTNGIVIPETIYQKMDGPLFDFNPSYGKITKNATAFVLNTYDFVEGCNYGGTFVRNLRDTKPFEPYVTAKSMSADSRVFFDIDGGTKTRSIHIIGTKPRIDDM